MTQSAEATTDNDFWRSSGFHLLERNPDGYLRVTPDFLRAYVARPELRPVEESCAAERSLHAALLEDPVRPIAETDLAAFQDPDGADNYRIFLAWRERLLARETLEAAYLAIFTQPGSPLPALFIDQLVHAILRNLLEGCDDPFRLRAGELLFRSQKVTIQDSGILLADEEVVESYAETGGLGSLGQLLVESNTPMRSIELDVLLDETAAVYWQRSDRFDTVLDLSFGKSGLDAFCRVLEAWVRHFLQVEVGVQPVPSIQDDKWVWHLGLDSEATALLNDLYEGRTVDEERMARLLALFRLEFRDPNVMLPRVKGRPVYLGLAMGSDKRLKVKPQNLLLNLPLAERA